MVSGLLKPATRSWDSMASFVGLIGTKGGAYLLFRYGIAMANSYLVGKEQAQLIGHGDKSEKMDVDISPAILAVVHSFVGFHQ